MKQMAKPRIAIAIRLTAIAVVLLVPFNVMSQHAGASWARTSSVSIATSSKYIPAFPSTLRGFQSDNGKDFWGHDFVMHGSMRVFDNNGWANIPDFPNTMNHCGEGIFMIRWKCANPNVRIASTLGYSPDLVTVKAKFGNCGYIVGTNCEQPLFKFIDTNGDTSNLADIHYELKFWRSAL